jgi:hypothetical protein
MMDAENTDHPRDRRILDARISAQDALCSASKQGRAVVLRSPSRRDEGGSCNRRLRLGWESREPWGMRVGAIARRKLRARNLTIGGSSYRRLQKREKVLQGRHERSSRKAGSWRRS